GRVHGGGPGVLVEAIAEALAPEVVARRIKLDDEDIRPSRAGEGPAAEVHAAIEKASEQDITRPVHGGGRLRGGRTGVIAEALTPEGHPRASGHPITVLVNAQRRAVLGHGHHLPRARPVAQPVALAGARAPLARADAERSRGAGIAEGRRARGAGAVI